MKLREIRGEAAFEALARLLAPVTELCGDPAFAAAAKAGATVGALVQTALDTHREAVTEILAALCGQPRASFSPTLPELAAALAELIEDRDVRALFTLPAPRGDGTAGG